MTIAKKINLFIIEDNPLYATALEQFLQTGFENTDHRVAIMSFKNAENCLEWLDCYGSGKPDIIILDYFLNGHFSHAMDGLNALFQLKLFNPDAEVIFLSSQTNMEVTVESFRSGAFDYIVKNEGAFKKVLSSVLFCIRELEGSGQNPSAKTHESVSL